MTIRQILRDAQGRLTAVGVKNADVDAGLLLGHILGEEPLKMRLDGFREVSAENRAAFDALLSRRLTREPLQYILGSTSFMGFEFHVEPGVLIPRADTEILCEEALLRIRSGMRILDIGTGSGALSVSLAKLAPECSVTAVDVSDRALDIAKGNAAANDANVRFVKSDCFDALGDEQFDVIVSNPPYISSEEMRGLMPEVLQEPELALFGGEDGLYFYERISRQAREHLAMGGFLLFEIGWQQKDAVSALVQTYIGEPFAKKDYGDNWRVVGAQRQK